MMPFLSLRAEPAAAAARADAGKRPNGVTVARAKAAPLFCKNSRRRITNSLEGVYILQPILLPRHLGINTRVDRALIIRITQAEDGRRFFQLLLLFATTSKSPLILRSSACSTVESHCELLRTHDLP